MILPSGTLSASVQALTLPRGLHLVTVTAASPRRVADNAELILPAIHVGLGPGVPPDQVEMLVGSRDSGFWLYEVRDTLVIKVVSGQAIVLLTTVRSGVDVDGGIAVEVTRLDAKAGPPIPSGALPALSGPASEATVSAAVARTPLRTPTGRVAVSARIDLHVQNKGDISYVDNFWAGALGERLAIEAFAIAPLADEPVEIEYAGVDETGNETGWIAAGALCGTRGTATALIGFAIRAKGESALGYDCEYRGAFSSGRIVGPVRNGTPCRSEPGDRLEAIQLYILPRTPEVQEPVRPRGGRKAKPKELAAPEPISVPEPRKVGPRFGVFRESVE